MQILDQMAKEVGRHTGLAPKNVSPMQQHGPTVNKIKWCEIADCLSCFQQIYVI